MVHFLFQALPRPFSRFVNKNNKTSRSILGLSQKKLALLSKKLALLSKKSALLFLKCLVFLLHLNRPFFRFRLLVKEKVKR